MKPESTAAPEAAKTRSPGEIERLFREHNGALLRFIAAKVGSDQEAREIAQEAYVHLLQLDHPEAISYLRAFLFKTAANLAVDRLRQRGRRSHVTTDDLDLAVFELSPEREIAGEQELAALRAVIEELPPKCRRAFLLHRVQDLRIEQIASLMNIGECMVRRYVVRALEHIRYRLESGPKHSGGSSR